MFDQAHVDQEKADRRAKAEAREAAEEEEEEQADESDHGNEIMLPKALWPRPSVVACASVRAPSSRNNPASVSSLT